MKNTVKGLIFSFILIGVVLWLNIFFQPDFGVERGYRGGKAFDEEPKNSVEVLFIGPSTMHHSVTPMEIYENYGISSWNLGSSLQPVSSSYYLLEDAYRLQQDSMKIVFYEVLPLDAISYDSMRRSINDAIYHYDIKYRANRDYTDNFKEAMDYTIPIISYHSRWNELTKIDFDKADANYRTYLRGYYLDTRTEYFYSLEYDQMTVPDYNTSFQAEDAVFTEESMYYLKKIIDFCNDNGLRLILLKSPMADNWDEEHHNAVQTIADYYDLTFLDFNYLPLFDEIGFNYATDMSDGEHMNYYGVQKLSLWLGDYLIRECGATDVRGHEAYSSLDEELDIYRDKVEDLVYLKALDNPAEYLEKAMTKGDYTIFICVKGDCAACLKDEQRAKFKDEGLSDLSAIGYRDSYVAVIDVANGSVYEERNMDPGETEDEAVVADNIGLMEESSLDDVREEKAEAKYKEENENNEDKVLEYKSNLPDGSPYVIKSGGKNLGDTASVIIDGEEYALNKGGINIVIYDNELNEVADSAVFNTDAYSERLGNHLEAELDKALKEDPDPESLYGDLRKLYLYDQRCDAARRGEDIGNEPNDGE